ncbi:MAG: TrkH family potassium uptake protein [Dehalococcoidia bacterium]|nr:TrkH family potassium uptake protein [Dehalococcoidia bacterium]MDH4366541.1 TrkH family potassium uptake protein [Dehalococcoidia bacterium]
MVRQRVRLTLHITGSFLKYFALAYILPLCVAIYYGEANWYIYLYALLLTLGVALILEFGFKTAKEIERTDGFTIVAFIWLLVALFGTLPYVFLGLGFLDGFFEAMSGFTTTGATILTGPAIEGFFSLPRSVLLWRSLTQWLGGMGVIALFIAILPRLGVGGSQLFDREFPSPLPERIRPRFSTTARLLWTIYIGFTAAQIVLLCFWARLPLFDSTCISFSTLSTGGFTPTVESIGFYGNPVAEYIIMVFMFLAGMSFIVHYHVLRGNWRAIKDDEFRLYIIIIAAAIFLLILAQDFGSYRKEMFQAISIMTTTGFVTADFGLWHSSAKMVLLALMFIGACGGSTGGGIKVVRIVTLIKHTRVMMRKAIFPNAVIPLKYNRKPLPEGIVRDIISFLFLYVLVALVASVVLSFLGLNVETAISAVAATLGNVGPGLADVGPSLSYAWLPGAAKVILIMCMWFGRLELFTVFMMFSRHFWKG